MARRLTGLAGYLPAALAAALTLVPVVYVVVRSLGADAEAVDRAFSARTVELLVNSVGLAAAVSITAVAISVPYAWLVTSSDLPGRRFFAATGALPLVVPSYVGALIMLAAFGPKGLAQDMLEGPFGLERMPEIYGFFGSWLVLTLFTYPYVLLLVTAAFRRIDPAMAEAARGLGHGPFASFMRATLPQLRPAIFAGALLCALYVLSDFGVVSLMRFDTFTIAIYTAYRSFFDAGGAALLALMLISLAAVLLVLEHKLRGDPLTQAARSARGAGSPWNSAAGSRPDSHSAVRSSRSPWPSPSPCSATGWRSDPTPIRRKALWPRRSSAPSRRRATRRCWPSSWRCRSPISPPAGPAAPRV